MKKTGPGHPAKHSRFRREQSGNPGGRPRGRKSDIPYDAVLGQMVTIREDGQEKRVTAAEALLLQIAKEGLEGNSVAARQALAAIEQAKAEGLVDDPGRRNIRIVTIYMSLNFNPALEPLRMGRKFDRYRPSARMMLAPWIVEAALGRMGGHKLSRDEQRIVLEATRTPRKVNWPDWWLELPE